MSRIRWIVALLVAAIAVPLGDGSADAGLLTCDFRANDTGPELRECVTLLGVRIHQGDLQRIADHNDGIRAAGTQGYADSVDYVVSHLRAAGYDPVVQEYDYLQFIELGPSALEAEAPVPETFDQGTDFEPMDQTEAGDVTAPVTPVDLQLGPGNASSSGCEAADFTGFPHGHIALLQRGTCGVETKAQTAAAAGAAGVVMFNQGDTAAPESQAVPAVTLTTDNTVDIPVMAASYPVGAQMAQTPGLTVRVFANSERSPTTTWNVLAESDTGRDDNVVMVGAHLDSVQAGPGINDNGSGAGTILEVAEDMQHVRPENRVRFAWWGAEELGTVGSAYYLSTLPPDQRDDIALYLNFDMIGSPNPVRFVYDGDGSEFGTTAPEGSAAIESFFRDFYADRHLASEPTRIEFSSDYAIFFGLGIPFGGVFTGSSGIKTPEQAAVYGGRAGQPYDPCYHAACDTVDNVDRGVLDLNADAVATATLHYAMSTESVNGVPGSTSWWPSWGSG